MSGTQNGRSPRSVALVGPYSSGKSTLFEALLDAAGAPVKRPADPRNRPMTTEIRLGHCSYLGDPWSILDCPGSIEFAHQTCSALAMVDIAVVVCEPTPSKAAMVAPLLKTLKEEGVPHIVFINKIDTLDGSIADTLAALQAYAASPLVLRQMPIFDGPTVTGYVDLMSERAYRYRKGQASELMQIPAAMLADEQDALGRLVETLGRQRRCAAGESAGGHKADPRRTVPRHAQRPSGWLRDRGSCSEPPKTPMVCAVCGKRCATTRQILPKPRSAGKSCRVERRVRRFSRPPMQATPASCPTPGFGAARSQTGRNSAERASAASIVS